MNDMGRQRTARRKTTNAGRSARRGESMDPVLTAVMANRLDGIVREMSKDSQFLLITHNKRTIEVADVLYGVTMEEKGVSKLVAVELH